MLYFAVAKYHDLACRFILTAFFVHNCKAHQYRIIAVYQVKMSRLKYCILKSNFHSTSATRLSGDLSGILAICLKCLYSIHYVY